MKDIDTRFNGFSISQEDKRFYIKCGWYFAGVIVGYLIGAGSL